MALLGADLPANVGPEEFHLGAGVRVTRARRTSSERIELTVDVEPASWVWVVREDPKNPDLLYAGTELGLLASFGGTVAWTTILVCFGGVTLLWGALGALKQTDLKRILAYSTVSSLGVLVALLGWDTKVAAEAAVVADAAKVAAAVAGLATSFHAL